MNIDRASASNAVTTITGAYPIGTPVSYRFWTSNPWQHGTIDMDKGCTAQAIA